MKMVDQLKIRDNTLVVVATEQGSGFPFGKWTCCEIGATSGLVVCWPRGVKPGG